MSILYTRSRVTLTPFAVTTALLLATGGLGCGDDLISSGSETASTGDGSTSSTTHATASSASETATTSSTSGGTDSDSASSTGDTTTTSTTTGETTTTGGTSEGSTTGITSTEGTTSSTGDTTTEGSTSTGDSDSDATGDTDGVVDCVDDNLPYAGALCGPEDAPCEIAVDEAVEAEHHFRNESPAVTFDTLCDPQVLYSIAEGGYHGYFSAREGEDLWPVDKTPFPIARIGLAYDHSADTTLALTYNGAFGTSLWTRIDGAWEETAPLAGKQIASAHGFARDPAGPLHAAVVTDGNAPRHAIYDGDWMTEDLGNQTPASATVALDGDGQPHMTFWSSKDQTWKLYYAAPPEAPEEIIALGSNVLNLQRQAVAPVPGDGNPLTTSAYTFAAVQQQGGLHELMLSKRIAPGKWEHTSVIAESDENAVLCQQVPMQNGQTCDYDYVRDIPLGILASADGDARFFFRETNYVGTLVAECVQMPFPICSWVPLSNENTSELRIGWPTENGAEWVKVLEDAFITDMSATIDAQGRIHIAAYDTENIQETMVRYLRLE